MPNPYTAMRDPLDFAPLLIRVRVYQGGSPRRGYEAVVSPTVCTRPNRPARISHPGMIEWTESALSRGYQEGYISPVAPGVKYFGRLKRVQLQ